MATLAEIINFFTFIISDLVATAAVPYASVEVGDVVTKNFGQIAGMIAGLLTFTGASVAGLQVMNEWRKWIAPPGSAFHNAILYVLSALNSVWFLSAMRYIVAQSPTKEPLDYDYGLKAGSLLYICLKLIGYHNTDPSAQFRP